MTKETAYEVHFEVPADIEFLGFTIKGKAPASIFVDSVEPGSWAEEVQLWAHVDEIFMLNGQHVSEMTNKEFKQEMKKRPLDVIFWRDESLADQPPLPPSPSLSASRAEKQPGHDEEALVESIDPEEEAFSAGRQKNEMKNDADRTVAKKSHNADDWGDGREFEVVFELPGALGFQVSGWPPEDVYVSSVEVGTWAHEMDVQVTWQRCSH